MQHVLHIEFRAVVIGDICGYESRECHTPCEMHSLTVGMDGTIISYRVAWTVNISPGNIASG